MYTHTHTLLLFFYCFSNSQIPHLWCSIKFFFPFLLKVPLRIFSHYVSVYFFVSFVNIKYSFLDFTWCLYLIIPLSCLFFHIWEAMYLILCFSLLEVQACAGHELPSSLPWCYLLKRSFHRCLSVGALEYCSIVLILTISLKTSLPTFKVLGISLAMLVGER